MLTLTLLTLTLAFAIHRTGASAQVETRHNRSTQAARAFRFPHGWLRQAFCIHRHESVDWYRAWVDWAGRPSRYAGGMQFTLSTWQRAGGLGEPWQWPVREQVYRAFVIWRMNGGSWVEWGTAGSCGLR